MSGPIQLTEIKSIPEYEEVRVAVRRKIIALKKVRRLALGKKVSLVFDNRETMIFQIHEMMRAEGISDPVALQAECDVYSALLPSATELAATLFIELEPGTDVRGELKNLLGIDEQIRLEIGETHIPAQFEEGRSREDRIATLQYIRFPFDDGQLAAFRDTAVPARIVINHPNYEASAEVNEAARQSLIEDLT